MLRLVIFVPHDEPSQQKVRSLIAADGAGDGNRAKPN
jgi:hypothetical protein